MWDLLVIYGMTRSGTKQVVAIRKYREFLGIKTDAASKRDETAWLVGYECGSAPVPRVFTFKQKEKARIKREKRKRPHKPKSQKAHPFYGSPKWILLKTRVLKKYGCQCMKCRCTNKEMHVDHIKPRSKYPELEMYASNLQILCRDCNMEKSNLNENDYRPEWAKSFNWIGWQLGDHI